MFLELAWPVTETGPFLNIAPRLWNSLPWDLGQMHNITLFQQKLKTHLFMLAFPTVLLPDRRLRVVYRKMRNTNVVLLFHFITACKRKITCNVLCAGTSMSRATSPSLRSQRFFSGSLLFQKPLPSLTDFSHDSFSQGLSLLSGLMDPNDVRKLSVPRLHTKPWLINW